MRRASLKGTQTTRKETRHLTVTVEGEDRDAA